MTPASRDPRILILAHRGFHRKARENTREAILAARDVGAHGVEFDVRTTADGHHVLVHNGTRLVRGRRRALSGLHRSALPSWIPGLEEILRRMMRWSGFVVDVELKEPKLQSRVLDLLRGMPLERLVVTSFHLPVCKEVARAIGGAKVGWLRERPQARDVAKAKRAGCRLLIVHRRGLRPGVVKATRRHHVELWVWGVNTVKRARAAAALGVRGIITDRPDLLLAADLASPGPPRTSGRTGRRGS